MELLVHAHTIEIKKTPVNEKEINITKCKFVFDDEITDEYVKEAYFTLNGESYKQIIVNNECDIPSEVLVEKGTLVIGVVATLIENEQYVKRYNPRPVYFGTWQRSLRDAENSEPITPSDKEQILQQLNNKQDKLIDGVNIKTINYESILGEGNINIQGGGGSVPTVDDEMLVFERGSSAYVLEEELILG